MRMLMLDMPTIDIVNNHATPTVCNVGSALKRLSAFWNASDCKLYQRVRHSALQKSQDTVMLCHTILCKTRKSPLRSPGVYGQV
jgi:hypothetical protein